jgi:hypothetical protein
MRPSNRRNLLTVLSTILIVITSASSNVAGLRRESPASKHDSGKDSVPKECAGADFATFGRPVMFHAYDGLLYGLSMNTERTKLGEPVPLSFWIVNTSAKTVVLSSCALDSVWKFGLEIHDASGRIPTMREEGDMQTRGTTILNPPCLRNVAVPVPAHSCVPPRSAVDLAWLYTLPAGRYTVSFRDGSLLAAKFTPAGTAAGVLITIEPK